MSIVTEVIDLIMDAIAATFTGLGTSLTVLWSSLIYDATTGFTVFAQWMLVFVGFSIGLGILYAVLRKVL